MTTITLDLLVDLDWLAEMSRRSLEGAAMMEDRRFVAIAKDVTLQRPTVPFAPLGSATVTLDVAGDIPLDRVASILINDLPEGVTAQVRL